MSVEQAMKEKLKNAFAPQVLRIDNESERHAHHRAMREEEPQQPGETHFRIYIVADAFSGKSRIERHRLVNDVLAEELAGPVHALSISALAPEEAEARPSDQ